MGIPVVDEADYSLFDTFDLGGQESYTRCIECQQYDFIAYWILHLVGCATAEKLKEKLKNLSEESADKLNKLIRSL